MLQRKQYNYRNTGNLIKTTIIAIIPKSSQGKDYDEYDECKASKYAIKLVPGESGC